MADTQQQASKENIGHVIQVLGAVVDIEFDSGIRPRLQTALRTTNPLLNDEPFNLVLEVAQHLGDCRVRAIAMGSTIGLVRGAEVKP